MLEFAVVLALHQIQKEQIFEKPNPVIEMKSNELSKPKIINKGIDKIAPKSGEDEHSKFKTDKKVAKLGCKGRFLILYQSLPLTTKIDLLSFSIFNLT